MPSKIKFTIQLNDEPYVDSFTKNKTADAYYTGLRYVKVEYAKTSGLIKHIVSHGDTIEDLNALTVYPEEGHEHLIIDGNENPWEASYLTADYEHDQVPTYDEDLGTLDEEGNPEIYHYEYSKEGSVLLNIYIPNDLKYVNGKFFKPKVRLHMVNNENYKNEIRLHLEMCDREMSRKVYNEEELQVLAKYKSWLENCTSKYKGIKHWKIKWPVLPPIKP